MLCAVTSQNNKVDRNHEKKIDAIRIRKAKKITEISGLTKCSTSKTEHSVADDPDSVKLHCKVITPFFRQNC